jgi:replicative DNA helicase
MVCHYHPLCEEERQASTLPSVPSAHPPISPAPSLHKAHEGRSEEARESKHAGGGCKSEEARGKHADFLTVCDELARRHQLDSVDGPGYITSLVNMVPSSANVLTYAQIVQRKAQYRRLIQAASQIAAWNYEEAPDALEWAEQCLFAIKQHHAAGLMPLATILADCLQDLDRIREQHSTLIGIPTGFHALDQALEGWQRGDLIVIAACPGTGKTSFAISVVAHALNVQDRRHLPLLSRLLSTSRKYCLTLLPKKPQPALVAG